MILFSLRRVLGVAVVTAAFAPESPAADLARVLQQDFAPRSGQVIDVRADDYLIDLDASAGIRIGDIFTVLRPSSSVVDPSTGNVLGVEESVIAALRVKELAGGFSKAVAVGHAGAVQAGDRVTRYAHLQAHFWDYTDEGERFFVQVRDALPGLRWVDYAVAQSWRPDRPAYAADGSSLYFILEPGVLEVRDGEGRLIHAYDVSTEGPGKAQYTTTAPLRDPGSAQAQLAPDPARAPAPTPASPPIVAAPWPTTRVPATPSAPPSELVGEFPDPVLSADFIHDAGTDLAAVTDGRSIAIFAITDRLEALADWSPPTRNEVVHLRWWRPQPAGALYVAAILWDEESPRATVLRYQDQQLEPVDSLPASLVSTLDRDGDGTPETLLRQESDPEAFFGRKVETLVLRNDALETEPLDATLPGQFTVTGSEWIDLTGDGSPELLLVKSGFLFIYEGDQLVYKSPRTAGGSVSTLNYNATPGMQDFLLETARFEFSPIAYDVDGDGLMEAILAASEGMPRMLPSIAASVEGSWLAAVRQEDGRFKLRPITETYEHPIQGFGLTPKGLYYLIKDELPRGRDAGRGALYRFPLYRK